MQQESYYAGGALWCGCHIMNMIYQCVYDTCPLPQVIPSKCTHVHVLWIYVTHLWLGKAHDCDTIVIWDVHEVYRCHDICHEGVSNIRYWYYTSVAP